uniref:Uncharacterized protein n=1 Tax=Glossina palpalis gambiensis TaxID=67801 RepID=A0A1B0ARJ5_9MUSC
MLGATLRPTAKIYNGINAKLREEINCPLCPEGKFCAILNAFKISMVAFMNASRASATFDVSERSTAILDNKPIIASVSAACISSGSDGVTGKQRVCTRIRRSPSLLVYNPNAEPGSWVSAKRFGSSFNRSLTSSLHSFKLTSKLSGRGKKGSKADYIHLRINVSSTQTTSHNIGTLYDRHLVASLRSIVAVNKQQNTPVVVEKLEAALVAVVAYWDTFVEPLQVDFAADYCSRDFVVSHLVVNLSQLMLLLEYNWHFETDSGSVPQLPGNYLISPGEAKLEESYFSRPFASFEVALGPMAVGHWHLCSNCLHYL